MPTSPSPSVAPITKAIKPNSNRRKLSLILQASLLSIVTLTTGCSVLQVYKIDIPQGTLVTQQQAQKLKVGMSANQTLYLLGSPAFRDTIEANRWDYIYDYQAGTNGKRAGKPNIHNAKHHLIVYFTGGKVSRIEG